MAEVQPKLVHKQFNSPIGLYSENNIKETINREIKAVGGIGIDLDDQISSKPSHLANSYVLKMLQEEESERYLVRNRKQQRSRYQKTNNKNINNNNNGINHENQYQQQRQQQQQKQRNNNGIKNNETNDNETINSIKSGGNLNEKNILPQQLKNNNMNVSGISERQSRPRHRFEQDKKITVDRNTVLKINRRHQNYYRDLSWPPPNNREPRSLSEDNCYYFDETIRKKHNIDNIRNLFEFGTIYERRASSFPKEIKNLPTTNLQKQDENFLSPDEINNKYNNKDAGQKFQSNFHENFITSDERISSSLPSTFEKSNKKNSIYNNNNKITTSNIPATTIGIKAPLTNNIIIRTPKSITIDQPLPPSMNKSLSSKMNENVICNSKNKVFNINNQMVSKSNSEIDEINNIERIPKQQQREEQNNQEYNRKDIINGNTIGKNFKIKSLNGKKNSAQHESTTIKSTHANKSDFSKCPIIVTRQPNNKNFTSNDNSNIAVVKLITDSNAKTTKINNALVNSSILTKDSNYQKITTTDDDDKNKINENNSNNLYKINQYQKIPTSLYSIKFQHLLSSSSSPLSSPIVFSSNRETEIVDVPTKISCSSSLSFKNLNEIITSNRQINNIPIPSDTKNLISQITLPLLTSSSLSLLPYSSPSSSTTETSIPIENINSKENNIFVSTQPPKTFVPEAKIQHKTVTFNNNNCSNNTDDGKINSEMLNKVNFNKIEKDDDNNILYMPSSLSSLSQENIKVNSKVKVMEQPSNMKHSKIMDNDSCIYTSATMCSPSYSSYSSFAAASTTNQRSHENLEFYKQKKLRDENLVQSVPSSSSLSSSSYFTPAATTNETIQNQESNIISNNMKKQILLKEIRERNNKSYIKNNQENNSNNNKKFQNNTKNYDSTNTIAVQKENILTKGYDTSHLNNDNDDVDHHDNDKISTYYSENEFNKNKNTTTFKTKIVDSPTKDQNDNTIPIKKLFDNNKFDIRDKNYITYTDGEYIYVPKKIPKNHIEMDEHIKEISKCQNMTDNNEKSCIKYNNNDNDSNEISNLIQKNLTIRAKSVPETKYSKYDNIEIGDITNYNSTSSNTDYKYEIIEKSIAEDLRRIDEFIETSLLKSSLSYDDYYNKYIRERLETPPIPPPRRHNIKYNILNSSSSSNVNNNEITSLPNTNTILVLETPLPIIKQMFIKTNSAIRSRSISPTTLIKSTTAATALKTLTTKSLDYKNDNNITSSSIYSSTSSSSTFLTTSNTPTTSCNIISTTHPIYSENNDFLKNLKEIYDLNIYKNNNGTTSTTATIIPLQCTIKSKAKEENIHPTNIMITESSISVPSSITSTSSSSLICEKFNISNAFNINNNDIDNLNNVYKEEKNIMNEKSNIDINGLNEIKGITNNSLVCKDNPIDYKQQEHNINIIDTSDLTLPSPPPPPLSYSISLTPTKNIITTFSTSSDSSSAAFASSTNYNSNTTGYSSSLMVNQMENMPVVENVLTDLDNISRELNNNFNNTNNNSNDDNNINNNQITNNTIISSNNKYKRIQFDSNSKYKNEMEQNSLQSTYYDSNKDMDTKLSCLQYNERDIKSYNLDNLQYKADGDKSNSELSELFKSQMDNSILEKSKLPTITITTTSSQTPSLEIEQITMEKSSNIEKNQINILDNNEIDLTYNDDHNQERSEDEQICTKSNYGLNRIAQIYGKNGNPDDTDDYDLYKIVESKNILSGYLITKQNQENLLNRAQAIIETSTSRCSNDTKIDFNNKINQDDISKNKINIDFNDDVVGASNAENLEISSSENVNSEKMENHQHLNKIKKPNQQKVVKHQKEEIIQDTTIQQKKQHKLNLVESTNSNELTFSDYLTGTTTASIDSDNNINENVITNSKEITKTSTSSSSSTLLSSSTKTLEETTKMAKKSLQSSLSSSSYNKIMNYTDNNSYRGNIQIDDNYNNINNIKTNTIITTTTNAGTTAAISASTISSSNKETYNKKLLNQQTTTDTTLDFSRGENNNSISMENISSTDDIKNAVDRKMNENTRYYKMYAEYPPTLMKSNKKTNNNNNIDNKIVCQNQQEEQQQQQNYNKQQKHHQYFSEQNYTDKSYDNITSRNDFSDDNYHSLSTHHKIDNKKSKDITTNIHNENINVKELLEKTSNEVNKNDITDTEIKTSRTSLILSSPSTPTPTSLHKPPTFKLPKVLVTTSSLSIDANDDSDIPFPSPVLSIYDNIDDINQSTIIDNNNKKNSKSQGTDKSNATLFTTPSTTASSSTPSSKITDNLTKIQCKKELDYISENNINKANNNEQILTDEIFQSVSELEEFEHLHHIQQQNLKRLQKEIMLSKINVLNDSDYNENLLHKNERDKLEMEQQQEEELKQKSNQIQLQQQQQTEQQIDVRSLETKNNNVNQIADQKNQQHQYHKRSPIDNTITTATITTITDSATTNSTNVNENYLKTKLYSEQCNQQIENISAAVNINDNEKLKESYNNNNIENSIMNEKKLTTNYNNIQQQQYSTIRDNIGVDDDGGNNNKSKINDIIINQKMSSNQYTSSSISENLKFEKSEQEYEKPQKMRKQQKLLEENSQNKTHLYLKNHQLDEHFQQQHEEQKQQQELHLESTNEIIDVCNSNKIKTKIQQKQQQQDTRQQRHEKRWSQETNNQTSGINVNNIENRDINRSKISQKELELNQINENQKLDQILQLSTNISTNATVDAVTLSQTTTPPHTPTIILSTSKRQENQQKQPTKSIFDNTFEQNNIQNVTTNIEKQSKDYNLKNTESIDDDNNNADTTESRTGSRSSKHYISKKFFKIRSFSQPPPLEYFQSYSPDEVSLVRNFIEAVDDATMRNNSNSNAPPPSDYNYNIENFKSFLSPNHNKKIDISTSISSNEDMRSETEVNDKVGNNFKDINSSTITNTTTATTNTNTCTNFTNVSASYDDDSRLCDNNDYMNDIKNNFTIDNTQFQPVKDKEEQLEKSSNNIQIDDIEKNHQKQDLQDDLCFDNSNHEKTMILENHQDQQHSYYDYYSSDPNLFFKDDIDDKGQLSITKQHDEKDDECNQWDDEEGYKRVAWPPTPERKIIREFTPQPQSQGDTNQGAPYLNNTPQTNHLPQQPSNRYLSPQPQSQPQNQPYQSQPQQQPPYLKQQNPSQQSQSYPGQQYFPKQQQQPQQHQQPSSFPSVPQHNQQHPQVNSYPSPHPQQQPQQPNQMNQSGPTVGFAGGIPVKAIPGLSPNEPPQQQYQQQNYRPQSPSNPQQQQQSQPIFQAQHQRYQQPEQNSVPAPYYQQPSQSYPQQNQQQQYQNQIPQQYSQNPSNLYGGWSHVSAPKYNRQPEQQQQQQQQHPMYAPSQQQYNQPQQQQQYPPNYSSAPVSQFGQSQGGQVGGGGQPQYQQQYNEPQQPHSGIVTLRKDPPYTQKPAPTVVSQPAAKSLRGGSLMRGDLKWPPEDCRERMAAEAELQRQLQLGPANRPTRLPKDYSSFFAKHALSHYYPGYKIPPGTQHIYAEF